jgi:uncharacterized oxidoreductase
MQATGNTILITGGGTGIGLGLAKTFSAWGNKVIIAGRQKKVLDEAAKICPGLACYELDVQKPDQIKSVTEKIVKDFPDLNVLINNAGIMRRENLQDHSDLSDMEAIIATNLMGPIRMTAALTPVLLKQPHAVVINVSSGLAFVPRAATPTYSATKAALHSYTESLRWQFRHTHLRVVELVPPYVATDLMDGANDPAAMPLDAFIAEVMDLIREYPHAPEICVQKVWLLRSCAESINYENVFQKMNESRK